MNNWHGWFIEQSLDDHTIFEKYRTVKMKSDAEDWKEHVVEISDDKLDEVIEWLKSHLKPAWYAHMVKDDGIVVVYRNMDFRLKKGESFGDIADYGMKQGIPESQLPSDKLFDLAYKSGY